MCIQFASLYKNNLGKYPKTAEFENRKTQFIYCTKISFDRESKTLAKKATFLKRKKERQSQERKLFQLCKEKTSLKKHLW